ncbi:MAG: hypothetical protein J6Q17_06640, partial [Clostridia bacterium]|nr:hypothetical protein [Clostridia bacterium]
MDSTFLHPTAGDEIEKTDMSDKAEDTEPAGEIKTAEEDVTAETSAEPEEKPAAPLAEITFGPDSGEAPVITSTVDPSPVSGPIGQTASAPIGRPMAAVACYG